MKKVLAGGGKNAYSIKQLLVLCQIFYRYTNGDHTTLSTAVNAQERFTTIEIGAFRDRESTSELKRPNAEDLLERDVLTSPRAELRVDSGLGVAGHTVVGSEGRYRVSVHLLRSVQHLRYPRYRCQYAGVYYSN